LNVKNN